jgi:SRSO17 transposase
LHYVLAVSKEQAFWIGKQAHRVDALISQQPEDTWQTLSAGRGSKGHRLYQWLYCRFEHPERPDLERGVLARRSLQNPNELAYYLVSAPVGTAIEQVVQIAGVRWTIETCFQTAKAEVGLDHYEVRSWHGWYRHITLCLLAHAFLTVMATSIFEVKKGELNTGSLFEFKRKRGLYYL